MLIGSLASQLSVFGFVAYGASKFAIRGIWEALSMECEPYNIRVIAAFPPSTGRNDDLDHDHHDYCTRVFAFLVWGSNCNLE